MEWLKGVIRSAKRNLLSRGNRKTLKPDDKLLSSDVFCMAPWIQLHAQTNGTVMPCCMSSVYHNNELGNLRENPSLEAAWNSENMKQLRLNMLNNQKSTLCDFCYKYESLGRKSERMHYNDSYFGYYGERIAATLPDGTFEAFNVPLLDIRFSNKCNYKCRICDSSYSSQWYEDEQRINKSPQLESAKVMQVSRDMEAFHKSFEKALQNVVRLHFAGGEPLVMDEHYQTLDYLISNGRRDVILSYNTNFSTLRYKQYNLIERWNQFEHVDVWASLDGMGAKGDYQRKGQRWDVVEDNLRKVGAACPGVLLGVNITVSMLNILDVTSFYKHLIENKLVKPDRVNLYLLFKPSYFNIINLTPRLKEKVLNNFAAFEKGYLSGIPGSENFINNMHAVQNHMMGEEGFMLPEFRQWISKVDKLRGEDFSTIFPELAELLDSD